MVGPSARNARLLDRAQVVTANGVRWASNIIVEIVSNYGRYMSDEQRQALKDASAALAQFQRAPFPPGHQP